MDYDITHKKQKASAHSIIKCQHCGTLIHWNDTYYWIEQKRGREFRNVYLCERCCEKYAQEKFQPSAGTDG